MELQTYSANKYFFFLYECAAFAIEIKCLDEEP